MAEEISQRHGEARATVAIPGEVELERAKHLGRTIAQSHPYASNRAVPPGLRQSVCRPRCDPQAGGAFAPCVRAAAPSFFAAKFCDAGLPYNHEAFFPVYDRAQELGMPIVFHAGFLAIGDPAEDRRLGVEDDNMRVTTLARVARWFPDLKIVAAHLGMPNAAEDVYLRHRGPTARAVIGRRIAWLVSRIRKRIGEMESVDMMLGEGDAIQHEESRATGSADTPVDSGDRGSARRIKRTGECHGTHLCR